MNDKYIMEQNKVLNTKQEKNKPNEQAGFYFSTHLKIFDPKTQKVLVQKRGDN
jgi:hypothetical protein